MVANGMRNGLSICFQCQGENLSELASEAGVSLGWELNEQPPDGKLCEQGNAGLPGPSRLWWGVGGREGAWLSRHVTSGLRGALHWRLVLCFVMEIFVGLLFVWFYQSGGMGQWNVCPGLGGHRLFSCTPTPSLIWFSATWSPCSPASS